MTSRIVVGPNGRQIATVGLQAPHEPRARVGELVDRLQAVDEVGDVGMIERMTRSVEMLNWASSNAPCGAIGRMRSQRPVPRRNGVRNYPRRRCVRHSVR